MRTPGRLLAAAMGLLAWSAIAVQAATLSVEVLDKEGRPVPDAAVLLRYVVAPSAKANNPAAVIIEQEKLQFRPYLSVVRPGTTLRFTNRDGFDHHIRATAPTSGGLPGKDFEARIAPDASKPFDVPVSDLGLYALSCHLHSRMRGYVLVTDTPWFGKTDAKGQVVLDNLPDGPVDVQLFHPEQFIDQPVQRVQLGKSPATVSGSLNFTPRVRRAS